MTSCAEKPNGTQCPPSSDWSTCRPWDITTQSKTNCYADSVQQETLNIAGAQVNVFKLLGVHEQTRLVDLTGNGTAISGGDAQNHAAAHAFDVFKTEWRSKQSDPTSVIASAYIGYDFGVVKLPNGRQRYSVDAAVRQHITTIKIKQGSESKNRVTRARVERSENGVDWFGVAIVNLPDDDQLNTIHFKHSVPNRYWRLRPLVFNGSSCDSWVVVALEMHDYSQTQVDNIQDKILLENRDREYDTAAALLKGYYDLVNVNTDLTRFGIEIPSASYQIKVNFTACVQQIGRPIVIGDIIELPSETQYTPSLTPIKRYLEVTDVTWDSTSYTPGWMPTMLLVTAQPALASEETQDIFGDLSRNVDSSGLFDVDDGNHTMYQDYSTIDQTIEQQAKTDVPEHGSEGSNVFRYFEEEDVEAAQDVGVPNISKLGFNDTGLYVEDALPQNGEPYTEGPEFPLSPKHGDYHRLTYVGLAQDVPTRLYRYSINKGRWVFLEVDKRAYYGASKTILNEYLTSPNRKPATEIK